MSRKNKKNSKTSEKQASLTASPTEVSPVFEGAIINTDSVDSHIINAYLASGGSGSQGAIFGVSNPLTGMGTSRDPLYYSTPSDNDSEDELTDDQIWQLYGRSSVIQNVVNTYPKEATIGKLQCNKKINVSEIDFYFSSQLKGDSLEKTFREASIESRLFGICWVVIGVNDGNSFDQPVGDAIQSIDWFKILTKKHIIPSKKESPDVYRFVINRVVINIHKSRLLIFTGDTVPISKKDDLRYTGVSVIRSIIDAFLLYKPSLYILGHILNDYSIFTLGIEGLEQKQKKSKATVVGRFLELQMLKNTTRGIAYDKDDEIPAFLNKNTSGIGEVFKPLEDFFIAETKMVRHKVLGSSNQEGLGNVGKGELERYTHAQNLHRWQKDHYLENLMYVYGLYFRSSTGITKGKLYPFSVNFPLQIELTPLEISQLYKTNVETMKLAVEAQFVTTEQASQALFGSNSLVLNPVINVNEDLGSKRNRSINGLGDASENDLNELTERESEDPGDTEYILEEINRDIEFPQYFKPVTSSKYTTRRRNETLTREGQLGKTRKL